jgi:hypothetical protein
VGNKDNKHNNKYTKNLNRKIRDKQSKIEEHTIYSASSIQTAFLPTINKEIYTANDCDPNQTDLEILILRLRRGWAWFPSQ